jgi:hypothetical protein
MRSVRLSMAVATFELAEVDVMSTPLEMESPYTKWTVPVQLAHTGHTICWYVAMRRTGVDNDKDKWSPPLGNIREAPVLLKCTAIGGKGPNLSMNIIVVVYGDAEDLLHMMGVPSVLSSMITRTSPIWNENR